MYNEKRRIASRLADRYAMDEVLGKSELIMVRGQHSATVYGCRKILLYSPCEIRLRVGKRVLCVLGEDLLCTCFSAGSVTVEGQIFGVIYDSEALKRNGNAVV